MKILIIGGTIFVGKHIVSEALKRGHEVTLFNRGKHNPGLFPEVEKITGDRLNDISLLAGRNFDAVIDTCGYFPRALRISSEALKNISPQYTFISSISVYKNLGTGQADENSETSSIEDESTEEITGETYGPLKRLCEKVTEEIFGASALILRPGLIVGEDDPTDRFTYWVRRVSEGGRMLIPDASESPVQFIDVKDLSLFAIDMIERNQSGVFNVTGPAKELSFGELLSVIEKVSGTKPEYIRMSEEFISEQGIAPYTELPLWVPSDSKGVNRTIISKALNCGFKTRPLEETIRDTLSFDRSRAGHEMRAGLSKAREIELLKMLAAANPG